MSTLERQLRWYVGLRLVVATSMALPYYLGRLSAFSSAFDRPAPSFFGELFAASCVLTLVYAGLLRTLGRWPALQAYLQFAGDLLLITALIYRFGGSSPFSPLYLVVIIAAGALLGQQAGLAVASAAYLLYAGVQLAFAFAWLPSPAGTAESGVSTRLLYSLFVNLVGFYAVAFLTSRLTRRAREAESALEVHREDLADLQVVHRDVVESIPSGLATTDLEGRLTTLNRVGRQILGLADEAPLGQPIQGAGLLTARQWEELTAESELGGRPRSEVRLGRGEEMVDIGFSLSRLTDGDGRHRGYILIFQDLTRWRKLEEEVRIKDRMAAVGELAAGLAHEIGNPLAAISGSVQMLARSAGTSSSDRKLLDILLKESQRLDRTIKGFLRFARPRERASVQFDVASLLAENVELLRNSPEISPHHTIDLALDPPKVSIVGDPDQISQIFWNLARNALRAMPQGGRLAISGQRTDGWYSMSFADTGRGMTPEERANLFHPFQSFFDSGTGIGMAIVYRIVQDHGGHLSVDSAPGQGSTIEVRLPATVRAAVEVPA
jgi:two-component system sensor histidine kinase PilS (NtrC family)